MIRLVFCIKTTIKHKKQFVFTCFLCPEHRRKQGFPKCKKKSHFFVKNRAENTQKILYIVCMDELRHNMLKNILGMWLSPRTDTQNNKGDQLIPYYSKIHG